ncbi:DUF5677 domain-containing protein [Methylobacillus sp. MM3]|jgi:hypothetical protein|uniref:DUF5677 domain-containing protein n=1 Tax=Methylobacillus sp. MM3 TaxID=1848039 RepID=UPI001969F26C|nr:DUF5677 domain-containing protein [Methylobacillus sp. MM3]
MSTDSPNLIDLAESMNEQSQRLKAASAIAATGATDIRDDLVRQHMLHSAELVRGAAALGREHNAACLGILARSLLETLISELWVVISTDNAEEQRKVEIAELARVLKINLQSDKAKIWNRHSGEDATAEFLETDRMKSIPKRKSVFDQAAEAGVTDLYNIFYRFLSMETHGHNKMKHPEEDDPHMLSTMHIQGIGAVNRAIGHVGVRWLLHRERTDNESLRDVLGLNGTQP